MWLLKGVAPHLSHTNHVSELEFFCGFREAFFAPTTEKYIYDDFVGAGLVSYNAERVLSKLDVRLRTPTPQTHS